MFGVDHVNFNLNDLTPSVTANGNKPKVLNGNTYNSVATSDGEPEKMTLQRLQQLNNELYRDPQDCIQNRKLPELPTPGSTTGVCP